MKLAVQECGRRLGAHLRAHDRAASEQKRLGLFQRYIPEVSAALASILGTPKDKIEQSFVKALPNFVRVATEPGGDPGGGGGNSGPSATPSRPEPSAGPSARPSKAAMQANVKGKKTGKSSQQLSLI